VASCIYGKRVTDHNQSADSGAAAVTMTVSADFIADHDDPARSLRSWLVDEHELRGHIRLMEGPPEPGQLGSWPETLAVVLAPGGAAAVLAGALVSWVRWHRSDLRVALRRRDGQRAEVEVNRLRGMDAATLPAVIDALGRWLDADLTEADSGLSAAAQLDDTSGGAIREIDAEEADRDGNR
jgi:membrane-associated two-gene conflict system component 1 (EACC1)